MNKRNAAHDSPDAVGRERDYYRREYNAIGGHLLRLQKEQEQTLQAARRARVLANLIRDAYQVTNAAATPGAIGRMLCQTIAEDTLSDRVAILRRLTGGNEFTILASVGLESGAALRTVEIVEPPSFTFSNATTLRNPLIDTLSSLIGAPYLLWAHDPSTGYALIVANRTEGNIHPPFEMGDQELIDGGLAVYMDIVVRKQAEVDLRQAKLEAEEAGRAQARFLAKLSHELRTPMNAILGFSDMIKMARAFGLDIEACAAYGDDINKSGVYLLSLIEDILDFAAYGQENPTLVETAMDVLDLLTEAERGLHAEAEEKGVAVRIELPAPLPPVRIDAVRMRQIVINLLSNAVKFTPAGGAVTLRASMDAATQEITIEVIDRGVGIAAADMSQVFVPFFQAGATNDDIQDGVGLGLTVAKALVEAHQGALQLESAPGQGTTARIILPAARTTAPQQRPL